jgi:hypothetical protein
VKSHNTINKGKYSFLIEGLLKSEISNADKYADAHFEYSELLKISKELFQAIDKFKAQLFKTMGYVRNREDLAIITDTESDVSSITVKLLRIKRDLESLYHYTGNIILGIDEHIESFEAIQKALDSNRLLVLNKRSYGKKNKKKKTTFENKKQIVTVG